MKLEDLTTIAQLNAFPSGGLFGHLRQRRWLPLDPGRVGQIPLSDTASKRQGCDHPLPDDGQRLLTPTAYPADHPVPQERPDPAPPAYSGGLYHKIHRRGYSPAGPHG